MKLEFFGQTDVGQRRAANEDAFLVSEEHSLFAVADGMGGHAAGEVAAGIAIDTFKEHYLNDTVGSPRIRLRNAVAQANTQIFKAAEENPAHQGMGTTLTGACIEEGRLVCAHVGDSRAYLLRSGKIYQITEDHTWLNEQIKNGLVEPGSSSHEMMKHVLSRALGTAEAIDVDVRERELNDGDRVILCSDGLTNMVPDEIILTFSEKHPDDLKKLCSSLISEANEQGGLDNITVVVAQLS